MADRVAVSDLPRSSSAQSVAEATTQPAAEAVAQPAAAAAAVAEVRIPEYPRAQRHLDVDFMRAKRESPHTLSPDRYIRMMAAERELCRNVPGISFEEAAQAFHFDDLWPIVCKLVQRPGLEKLYIGVSTDLEWRWSRCESHPSMQPHCLAGWHRMYALSCSYGDAACSMERLLQAKLGDHFERQCAHASYRRGPVKSGHVAFLYALVKYSK